MRVLFVGVDLDTFVSEQCDALGDKGVEVFKYRIKGHGIIGYLKEMLNLHKAITECRPDLIHAHYGLSGLCANMQRRVPVVTTYHGSDIHSGGWILKLSRLAMRLSAYNVFVSKKMWDLAGCNKDNSCVLPCGIDLNKIHDITNDIGRKELGLDVNKQIVLFSGSFSNDIKNPILAKEAMNKVAEAELIELKGYTREEVNILMNAADCLLMTSHREGSPQVIKEAMACGTPIVSVDVGDVKEVIGNTEGCYIAERNPENLAEKIRMALAFKGKTNGRQRIIDLGLSNDLVAKRLVKIYEGVLEHVIK